MRFKFFFFLFILGLFIPLHSAEVESCNLENEIEHLQEYSMCSSQLNLLACGALGSVIAKRSISLQYEKQLEYYQNHQGAKSRAQFLKENWRLIQEQEKILEHRKRNYIKDRASTDYVLQNFEWLQDPKKRELEKKRLLKLIENIPDGKSIYVKEELIFPQHKLEAIEFFENGKLQVDKGSGASKRLGAYDYNADPDRSFQARSATKKEWRAYQQQWELRKKAFQLAGNNKNLREKYTNFYNDLKSHKYSSSELAEKYSLPKSFVVKLKENYSGQMRRLLQGGLSEAGLAARAVARKSAKLMSLGLVGMLVFVAEEGVAGSSIPACGEFDVAYVDRDRENQCKKRYEIGPSVLNFLSLSKKEQKQVLSEPSICDYYQKLYKELFVETQYTDLKCNGKNSLELTQTRKNQSQTISVQMREDGSVKKIEQASTEWNFSADSSLLNYGIRRAGNGLLFEQTDFTQVEDFAVKTSEEHKQAQVSAMQFQLVMGELVSCCTSSKAGNGCKSFFASRKTKTKKASSSAVQ